MALHNDVFNQQIWDFFSNDMDSCFEVSKNKQKFQSKSPFKGGLNFTAALAILSVIDFCAAFYYGRRVSQPEIAVFMNKYFSKYDDTFNSTDRCEKFYNVFRNGLSHQWSPKASGIAMNFSSGILVGIVDDILILNVPKFYQVVISGIKDYEEDMDDGNYLDEFKQRYEDILVTDSNAARLLKTELGL